MVLYLVLEELEVDLTQRLLNGQLLKLGEVEELARQCRYSLDDVVANTHHCRPANRPKPIGLRQIHLRHSGGAGGLLVDADTAAIRLRHIHAYLKWRVTDHALKMGVDHPLRASFLESANLSLRALYERLPRASRRDTSTEREGLAENDLSLLLEVIDPAFSGNPWTGEHPRLRNELITRWLLELGIRRGELLGIRISDINFQRDEVLIARQADNPLDPRKYQPNTKTNGRLLSLGEQLSRLTRTYIQGPRRAIRGARKHDFLFVANGTGRPLTLAAVNKVFDVLRTKVPGLPDDLSPHVLRHTWNDEFSALMDQRNVPEEREKQMRSRLMGWSETSGTAATYTRRHTKRKAKEAAIALQHQLTRRRPDGP